MFYLFLNQYLENKFYNKLIFDYSDCNGNYLNEVIR